MKVSKMKSLPINTPDSVSHHMTRIPPDLPTDHFSTPKAHTTYLPTSELQQIESETGTPQSELGKLTVSESAEDLFNAVRFYASLSPVPIGHPSVPLLVNSCSETNDDDILHVEGHDRVSNRKENNNDNESIFENPSVRPVYCLANSRVTIVWPPPSHLNPSSLIRLKNLNPCRDLHKVLIENGHKDVGADDGIERSKIHLYYYTVGDPMQNYKNSNEFIKPMEELLLVSEKGMKPLTRFTEDVLAWHKHVQSAPDLHSRFPLYRFKIYCQRGVWNNEGLKRARLADSVVLAGDLMETILGEVENFTSPATRTWYLRHGFPYRRSFLFFGPPGTGKTSTARVIASKFKRTCCVLNMANDTFSNQLLGDALTKIPEKPLLLLEDVDALFNENRSNKQESQLTFSGLLNALDGIGSVEGVITVMTTNHIDRLEKALIRGGRVDRKFKFDHPRDEQLERLFMSFYPKSSAELAGKFVKNVRANSHVEDAGAISTLQQLFIAMKKRSAEDCVEGVSGFLRKRTKSGHKANTMSYIL